MATQPQIDFVFKTINSRDVHFIRLWFCDLLGNIKSFSITPDELDAAFAEGIAFDPTPIIGFGEDRQDRVLVFPRPDTFQILPWRPQNQAVARMFCDLKQIDGSSFDGDSRNVLISAIKKASEMGFHLDISPEIEHYYFKNSNKCKPLDRGSYFDLTSLDSASDLRRDTILTLESMGIPTKYSMHERGPSQHEIKLRSADALLMADSIMTHKLAVKEIAEEHGVFASFMPKPMDGHPGSSMKLNLRITDADGENLFFPNKDEDGLYSLVAKRFMSGLIRYAPEYCLITNQYVNSYKRLCGSDFSPIELSWSSYNPSSLIYAPTYNHGNKNSCKVNLILPDSACNPYLTLAVILEAGLKGVCEEFEVINPDCIFNSKNVAAPESLPTNLGEAIFYFSQSDFMQEVLGDRIFNYLVEIKAAEWRSYQSSVTDWDRDKFLSVL